MLGFLRGAARAAFILIVLAALGIAGVAGLTLWHFGRDLPDTQQLVDYVPAVGSKVYAGDGSFLIEFESEHRIPVTIEQVPRFVVEAFLAAEDRDFYKHKGVNPTAVLRAAAEDILRLGRGQRPIGASTITQQVVRHFLLNNQVSVARKIKEIILAYQIEHTLSKDRILEIYLNEIYLGAGSYGVAAAADAYFQKPLDRLSLGEAALLAALPKAPNNYNPLRHPDAARARRDWILSGMAEEGWISKGQAKAAMAEPLDAHLRGDAAAGSGSSGGGQDGYFVEEVRRELVARFGEKAVYEGGLSVRTSYVPIYQQMAETAFRNGLVEYDRRHGWRGPIAHLPTGAAAEVALSGMADPPGIVGSSPGSAPGTSWQLAAVTATDYRGGATIALKSGGVGHIPLGELLWARHTLADQRLGPPVRSVRDVLSPGDIVLVAPVAAAAGAAAAAAVAPGRGRPFDRLRTALAATYALRQIPDVSGGIVVMDPKTGRVFAVVGGWSFRQSQFDRAVQALRQPGSAFKPFVYVTALENGFTPDTTVDDSPVSVPQGPGLPPWQPVNYEEGYVGPTTLEDALIHSRNLATVHVALSIGLKPIAKTVQDFGILDHMPLYYAMVLGAGDTTLMRLTAAYSMLDNGGHWLLPSLIDLVQDRTGHIIYQKGVNGCAACFIATGARDASDSNSLYRAGGSADPSMIWLAKASYADGATVYRPTKPDPLVTLDADYQIVEMMQGVVQHGTGIVVSTVGKPLAGKTGTTSDWFDAWFVGFSPEITAGVYVGFDDPRTLGDGEVGGHVAAPIFRDFMAAALAGKPATPFPAPSDTAPEIASTAAPDRSGAAESDQDADSPDSDTASRDDRQPPPPSWRDEAPPSERDDTDAAAPPPPPSSPPRGYAAAQMPDYPVPWTAPWPAPWPSEASPPPPIRPRYGAAPSPPYQPPGMPPFPPPPGWAMRPGGGTGGLY
jgi:penicillin-binding protein 1A